MQVSMVEAKFASLPPIVTLTRVVDALRVESWLLMTSEVVAPEQATNENDATEFADAHREG
jgi:hypothetical protein